MRISGDTLIDAPVDLSQPWTSPAIWIGHISMFSIRVEWTGTPLGVFYLEGSTDPGNPNAQSAVQQYSGVENWTTVQDSEQAVNTDGNHMWNHRAPGWFWVRVVWDPTSGSGSLTKARFSAKGV